MFEDLDDSLTLLWLADNSLSSLPEDIFDGLTGLETLTLDGNSLTALETDLFDPLDDSLTTLTLRDNSLTALHADIFDGLDGLANLDLSENSSLTTLPAAVFADLDVSLTTLFIRSNGLTALPANIFVGLTGLQRLDLSCNALTALDLTRFDPFAASLIFLDLGANSFATAPTDAAVRAKLTNTDLSLFLTGTAPCSPPTEVGLSALTVSAGTLDPAFEAPGAAQYAVEVAHDVSTITITPTLKDSDTSFDFRNHDSDPDTAGIQVDLEYGLNSRVTFDVIPKDGRANLKGQYSVTVTREFPPSADARLGGLELSGATLSPGFATATAAYTGAYPTNTTPLTTVTAPPLDPDAAVAITPADADTSTEGHQVDLAIGSNTITVKVTAEDGAATQTYTATVTRTASTDASLRSLSLSGVTLNPEFTSTRTSYTASVAKSVSTTTVTSETTHSKATAVIKLGGVVDSDGTVSLALGDNVVTVEVTAEDGTAMQTYTVTVKRVEATVTVSVPSLTISEGMNASYTVVLEPAPTGDVTIEIGGHTDTDVSVNPAMLTFTTMNWNTAQTVTVTAGQDDDAADDSVTLTHAVAAGSAAEYLAATTANVDVTVDDDETDGVTVSEPSLEIDEGENDSYTVRLNTEPTADVTIEIGGHTGTDVSVNPTSLTFTTMNWSTAQSVTVTAGQDNDAANDTVALTHTIAAGSAAEYGSVTIAGLNVTVDDDETARVTISPSPLPVDEESNASYTVRLATEPTGDVTINISGYTGTDVSVSPASLTLTTANWSTGLSVTVSAADDGDTTGESVTLTHAVASGSATEYLRLSTDLQVNVTDNDTSSDATLHSLFLYALDFSPSFSPGVTSYTANAPNAYTAIRVEVTTHPDATTVINGVGIRPNTPGEAFVRTVDLAVGDNTITIEVTAQDEVTKNTYTVMVSRTVTPPPAPESFQADLFVPYSGSPPRGTPHGAQNGIAVFWSSLKGAAEYKVEYRKDGDTGDWTRVTIGDFDSLPSTSNHRGLLAVATGLECETAYDFRLSARGDGTHYNNAFGDYATLEDVKTGPCAKENQATNLRITIEPQCATLTWTAPTGSLITHYRLSRVTWPGGTGSGGNPVLETLEERLTRSRMSYRDCSPEYRVDGNDYGYRLQHLGENGEVLYQDENGEAISNLLTPVKSYGAQGLPDEPRNVRFTRDTQSRRSLSWVAPPSHHLTMERAFRGETTRPVADPWDNYRVERGEYAQFLWTAELTVGKEINVVSGFTGTTIFTRYGFYRIGPTGKFTPDQKTPGEEDEFSYSGQKYLVEFLFVLHTLNPDSGVDFLALELLLSPPPAAVNVGDTATTVDVADNWTLVLDNGEFLLASSDPIMAGTGAQSYRWRPLSDQPWEDGETTYVALKSDRGTLTVGGWRNRQESTATSFTDSENAGSRVYVYRVRTVNSRDISSRYTDWLWMNPPEGGTSRNTAPPVDERAPLTANFEGAPESHNGTDAFTFRIAFSEAVSISAGDLRDHALTVLGGTATAAQQVDGRGDLREITVQPDSTGGVNVLLAPPADCDAQGAICTGDGKLLSIGLGFQIPGLPLLSVADAQATEGPNVTLDFVVTRSGTTSDTATVDYATADGTATAGSDYVAASSTLTFQPGDRTKTVEVHVINDTVNDGGETFTLNLSNANGAEIADGQATGTILNVEHNRPATGQPTISGSAQVGETLTLSTSGIADEDGLNNVSFNYQWVADNSDIAGATGSTYTLASGNQGKTVKVRVSFTDDRGNPETLTSAATATVKPPPPPLTASFESAPASHNGADAFTFELRFSEEFGISYKTLRDHAFTVTGGEVTKARRLTQGSNLGWEIHVVPDSNAAVSVVLPVTTDCTATGAVCTADGRMLSNQNELTVSGPEG